MDQEILNSYSRINHLNVSRETFLDFENYISMILEKNKKINIISQNTASKKAIIERHIIDSAQIIDFVNLNSYTTTDLGSGGGFPGIPLAILFPESNFYLVDTIGKKIKVVNAVAQALELKNVEGVQKRAEKVTYEFDFIISRAVTYLPRFNNWIKGKFSDESFNDIPNGLLYLKGGDLSEELKEAGKPHKSYDLKDFFSEDFFDTKKVIYLEAF